MRKEDLILINTDKQSIITVRKSTPIVASTVTKLAMLVLAPQDSLNSHTKKNSQ